MYICGVKRLKMGKTLIEKHLLQPKTVDGIAQVDGPEYYVYRVDEMGNKEFVDVVYGDVKEAVRRGERILDLDEIEMAFRKNPESFSSFSPIPPGTFTDIKKAYVITSPEDVQMVFETCITSLWQSLDSHKADDMFKMAYEALTENAPQTDGK